MMAIGPNAIVIVQVLGVPHHGSSLALMHCATQVWTVLLSAKYCASLQALHLLVSCIKPPLGLCKLVINLLQSWHGVTSVGPRQQLLLNDVQFG